MYFAALISLAFTSNNLIQSMYDALVVIPQDGALFKELSWALSVMEQVTDYTIANRLVTERYPAMSWVHATNNACLTIWGIHLGWNDFTKGISQTVAMAYDNDCTAATVGSVLGAYLGIDAIDPKWYQPWNNRILSYLHGIPEFQLSDVVDRFFRLGTQHLR
jgi:ADP-ribosylglycohydrolase